MGRPAAAATVPSCICLWFIAQVSHDAPPVDMQNLLMTSLTGDNAIAASVPALVIRVENIYEAGEQYFAVDASADWSGGPIELSVRDAPDRRPQYAVAGFVAHESDAAVDGRRRMRSGHYIAYVQCEGSWFELNDSQITALGEPPKRFPYLVFLTRADGRRMLRGKQAGTTTDAMMLALLQKRAAACVSAVTTSASEPPASKRSDGGVRATRSRHVKAP